MALNVNTINDNINVNFELTPKFNDGMLHEADIPAFLDQIANTLAFIHPISAKLDDLYCFDGDEFIVNPTCDKESDVNRNFIQILTNNNSFTISAVLSVIEHIYPYQMIPSFMQAMSNDDGFDIFWLFDVDTLDKLCDSSAITPTTLDVISFTFGNLINDNRFVTHLNDLGAKFNSERVTSNCNIFKDVVIESKRTFEVQFKINYYDPVASVYDDKSCKLTFQPDSVNEIITSMNEGIEFYFKLDFPPKLYIESVNEKFIGDDHSIARPEDAIISAETIGKSNTFMIKIKTDSSDYREYARILKIMYSKFFEKSHRFVFSPIFTYCVDYSDKLFDKLNNFPFEVKYALECITSLSYAFKDDLYINGTKELFYNYIQSRLDDGQEKLLTEVLYQFFQQIVDGEVTNSFTDFVALFHDLKDDTNERSVNRKHQLVKRIILTPTRTLYLPPTPSRTKFMIERVNLNSTIIVYFRDDDKSYTSCGPFSILTHDIAGKDFTRFLDDVRFGTDFIERVVQKRLFKQHGFISAQPMRYLGTSISQIFSYGILVQANTESSWIFC